MSVGIAITRTDLDAKGLRQAAARSDDASAARRMLALAMLLEGASRTEAAETCGMDRQSLRDWVHRYNAEGLAGLFDRKGTGRPPRLSGEQKAEIAALVEQGPDPKTDVVVRWRRVDLQRVIEDRFGVRLAERTVGKLLNKLGFRKISARPAHPQGDVEARETFKKTSPTWSRKRSPSGPKASPSKSGFRTRRASASKAR